MKKIIYISPSRSSFVERDIRFLGNHFKVLAPQLNWNNKLLLPITMVRQKLFLLRYIWSAEAIIIMFGGYWSVVPVVLGRITGKPVYIITGGTDCVSFPEYNYGSLRKPLLSRVIGISFRFATRILPVSQTLVDSEYSYDKVLIKKQGFLNFFPKISTPYTVIHNGYDHTEYSRGTKMKDFNSFLTVAFISDHTRFLLKGGDMIIDLAKEKPDMNFTIAGLSSDMIGQLAPLIPGNLKLLPPVSSKEAKILMEAAGIYLSLSLSEGFPNAICEAMLMGCIPVGSDVGATSEIIGDTGFIIKEKKKELLLTAINRLIALPIINKEELSSGARKRIVDNFSLSRREEKLIEVLTGKQ